MREFVYKQSYAKSKGIEKLSGERTIGVAQQNITY
jgi:hypothetical protein